MERQRLFRFTGWDKGTDYQIFIRTRVDNGKVFLVLKDHKGLADESVGGEHPVVLAVIYPLGLDKGN